MEYKGAIIEENQDDSSILKRLKIKKTEVEAVTPAFHTPWLKKWTLHTVVVPEKEADKVAKTVSDALSTKHS